MRKVILLLPALLMCSTLFSQTDKTNLDKYWKFRNDFVQKFVKIGPNPGESLPAISIGPIECKDNIASDGTNPAWNQTTEYGTMTWGDGMIYHGHYLSLLATEYALKKKNNIDFTGTLSELYYALMAINRLDQKAEVELSGIYGLPFFYDNLANDNGFYLRDDIPEDFNLNWSTDQLAAGCVESDFYDNNNMGKVNDPGSGLITNNITSNRNVPSADQMTSLLVGLSMVHKLVDFTGLVQPKPTDLAIIIDDETKVIVGKMIDYSANRNWFIIDVNGWPVPNGGGELVLSAYPMLLANQTITGNSVNNYNLDAKRRSRTNFANIQHCITGYGLDMGPSEQGTACSNVNQNSNTYNSLYPGGAYGGQNYQGGSVYQTWEQGGLWTIDVTATANFWSTTMPDNYPAVLMDYEDDNKFALLPWPLNQIEFSDANLSHYNTTIYFQLGVMSGLWDQNQANTWGNQTGNRELELINAVLKDQPAYYPKWYYQQYLDNMEPEGPFDFKVWDWPPTQSAQMYALNGWGSSYRWINPDVAFGDMGDKGIYNAMDYMVFHNLYYLLFDDDLDPFEETFNCFCQETIQVPVTGTAEAQEAKQNLNDKLKYLPTCRSNAFAPTFNMVTGVFNIDPKFPDYYDMGIRTTKFQIENATVESTGTVNVNEDLVICGNKTLEIKAGGFVNTIIGNILVKPVSVIDVSGELRIGADTKIQFGSNAKIILRSGAKLIIEDNAQLLVDFGGVLHFYDGAEIIMEGNDSEILLRGGITVMDGGIFQINHINGVSGRFIIDSDFAGINAAINPSNSAEIILNGTGPNDDFLIINDGFSLDFIDYPSSNLYKVKIHSSKVTMGENTSINCAKYFNTWNCNYVSDAVNDGIHVNAYNKFSGCDFTNIPIYGELSFQQSQKLQVISCNFTNEAGVNDAHDAIIDVNGTGVYINNCTFLGSNAYLIKTDNLEHLSQISNSIFNENTPVGQSVTTFGVSDGSSAEIKFIGNHFDHLYNPIIKGGGELTLKCNIFDNSLMFDVAAVNGCHLNASTDDYGGYNYFNSPSATSIFLQAASINLTNGRNYFNPTSSVHIWGNVNYPCIANSDCAIDARRNQWNTGLQAPAQSKFNVSGSNSLSFLVTASLTEMIPACGFYDGTGGPQAEDEDLYSLPVLNVSFSPEIRVDYAIQHARNLMTSNNEDGNDAEAIAAFEEIIAYEYADKSAMTELLLNQALLDMKTAVASDVYNQNVLGNTERDGVEPNINLYTSALNAMTPEVVNRDNYEQAFYTELDKAHLFRLYDKPAAGLDILTNLEACGLDESEQQQVNDWKTEFKIDLVIEEIGMDYLDTVIVIDTNDYIIPIRNTSEEFNFGAKFYTINFVEYPECSNGGRMGNFNNDKKESDIIVYPNPAHESINIEINRPLNSPNATIYFYTSDGKLIDQIDFNNGTQSLREYSIADWLPGIYFIELVEGEVKTKHGKLIVE